MELPLSFCIFTFNLRTSLRKNRCRFVITLASPTPPHASLQGSAVLILPNVAITFDPFGDPYAVKHNVMLILIIPPDRSPQ